MASAAAEMRAVRPSRATRLPTGTIGISLWAVAIFAVLMAATVGRHELANDFHHTFWPAAQDVLNGRSPIGPAAGPGAFPFVYPPIAAFLFAPFGLLPQGVGDAVMTGICVLSALGALWALGVRDARCYAAAFLSFPVFSAIQNANVSLPLVLAVALIWRYRDDRVRAACLVALCVAVKLFVWPLLVWLAVTRWRTGVLAAVVAAGISLAGWAAVGFGEISHFLHVLKVFDRLAEQSTYTPFALLSRLGLGSVPAHVIAYAIGAGMLAAIVVLARRAEGDRRAFVAAIAASLLLSPVVWLHYLTLLLVPLALVRPKFSLVWLAGVLTFGFTQPPGRPSVLELAVAMGVMAVTLAPGLSSSAPHAGPHRSRSRLVRGVRPLENPAGGG
jgi:alpha-1,2-mannosyltransferase